MNAIITLTNSKYLWGNILLYHSLKKNKLKTKFIVMHDNELTKIEKKILKNYGINNIIECEKIENPYAKNRFVNVFSKLNCWKMTEYEKIIFIDNDVINLKNFEELFKIEIKENEIMGAKARIKLENNKEIDTMLTGFFLIKPDKYIYKELIKNKGILNSYDDGDQGYLNSFFKFKTRYIDEKYNMPKRKKDKNIEEIVNLHYVGAQKPWNERGEKGYEEYNSIWIEEFKDCVDKYWKNILNDELNEMDKIVYNGINKVEGNLLYKHNLIEPTKKIWYEAEAKRQKIYEIAKDSKNVLEIGVNGGHSALIMLKANPDIEYNGFDINHHPYTQKAINYLKKVYKNINYIIGDSEKTVPVFNKNIKFDLIHIDGGHTKEKALNDIINCKKYADENTILIFDDCNKVGKIGEKLLKLINELIKEKYLYYVEELNTYQNDWDNKVLRYNMKKKDKDLDKNKLIGKKNVSNKRMETQAHTNESKNNKKKKDDKKKEKKKDDKKKEKKKDDKKKMKNKDDKKKRKDDKKKKKK